MGWGEWNGDELMRRIELARDSSHRDLGHHERLGVFTPRQLIGGVGAEAGQSAVTLRRYKDIGSPQPGWRRVKPGTIAKINPGVFSSCGHLNAICCDCS
jgi:hypothetical protein